MGLFNQNSSSPYQAWFNELRPLHHRERIRRTALFALEQAESGKAGLLFDFLITKDVFGKMLACHVARHANLAHRLPELFTDSSITVTTSALNAWFRNTFTSDLPDWSRINHSEFTLRGFCKRIVRHNREDFADAIQPLLKEAGRKDLAAKVIPACSEEFIQQHLNELQEYPISWKKMSVRYPERTSRYISDQIKGTTPVFVPQVWRKFDNALSQLWLSHGKMFLDLLLENAPENFFPESFWRKAGFLYRQYPDRVHQVFLRPGYLKTVRQTGLWGTSAKISAQFPSDKLIPIATAISRNPAQISNLFRYIPRTLRGELFREIYPEGTPSAGFPGLLGLLPPELRQAEARKLLANEDNFLTLQQKFAITVLLPFEEAFETLKKFGHASDETERGQALAAIMETANINERGFETALNYLKKIENDQDPVRGAVWGRINQIPFNRVSPDVIPYLWGLINPIFEARDSSWNTIWYVNRLFEKVIQHFGNQTDSLFFDFAIQLFKKISFARKSYFHLPPMDKHLRQKDVEKFVSGMAEAIDSQIHSEYYNLVFYIAGALGKWVEYSPTMQKWLAKLAFSVNISTAQNAITYWLKAPETREERVRKLLDHDASVVAIPQVFQTLHQYRQDWLAPYLTGQPISGKWLTGNTVWVPHATGGFYRWHPEQQQGLSRYLFQISHETFRPDYTRASVLRKLGLLYILQPADFQIFWEDERQLIREAALGAIIQSDVPGEALPHLLGFLDKPEARVAMYAIPRAIRFVPVATGMKILENLLAREYLKVTVRKEVVRLLGALKLDTDARLLQKEWEKPGTHKDVRIAIGHAARALIEYPKAFALLETLAQSTDPDMIRSMISVSPATFQPYAREQYLGLLGKFALHPDYRVREALFSSLRPWVPGLEKQTAEICTTYLKSTIQAAQAASEMPCISLIVEIASAPDYFYLLPQMLREIEQMPAEIEWQQGRSDLPYFRRAAALWDKMFDQYRNQSLQIPPDAIRSLISIADQNPIRVQEQAYLHFIRIESEADFPTRLLDYLDTVEGFGPVSFAVNWIVRYADLYPHPENRAIHLKMIRKGYSRSVQTADMMILLFRQIVNVDGWNEEKREILTTYRKHPDVGVRRRAWDIVV